MTTTIHSNGSGRILPIEELFSRLQSEPLDRTFDDDRFGRFVYAHDTEPGVVCFFGNFHTYSHVFNICTDDAELIERLTAAIRLNQQRPDYLSQQTYVDEEAERAAREAARRQKNNDERKRQALAILGMD